MKKRICFIGISLLLLITALCIPAHFLYLRVAAFIAAYLTVGGRVVLEAISGIFRLEVLDEDFLMTAATIGAFALGEYTEAVAVMLLFSVGELFEQYAVGRSRKSVASLMAIRPDYAVLLQKNGESKRVTPETVAVGDFILVSPGEKIPLDGIVSDGTATLDTAALTGEAMPRTVQTGDAVQSGCINLSGVLTIQVTATFENSTVSKILELVENASIRKAKAENFITKFATVYTPIVVVCAVLLAILPPLLFAEQTFADWTYRALTFLMVSCPCALVISVPLTFFGGIGGAAKAGILFKGGNYVEALADVKTVVFDKTGTLTEGRFSVQEICPTEMSQEKLLYYAAHAECFSGHPIAVSLREAYHAPVQPQRVTDITESAGNGLRATVDGVEVLLGNRQMFSPDFPIPVVSDIGTVVFIAIQGTYAGYIRITDTIKADSKTTINALKQAHIHTVMLTGDNHTTAQSVANTLGIDTVYAELLPRDKVEKVESLLVPTKQKLLFVGDGINDAPVLMRADIGVAMGACGSDAAIEAADIVLMTDEPAKLLQAISIARKTRRIVRQNITFALTIKLAVLIMGALGLVGMWAAVIADVGVSVVAVCNALRMLKAR